MYMKMPVWANMTWKNLIYDTRVIVDNFVDKENKPMKIKGF